MDRDLLQKINHKVVSNFPEMRGVSPSLKREQTRSGLRFRLTYKGKVELPEGRTMKRVIHVLADERGKILRMSASK
jgi:hypothetical protein